MLIEGGVFQSAIDNQQSTISNSTSRLSDPVARPGAATRDPIPRIRKLTSIERETAAPDALAEAGLHALEQFSERLHKTGRSLLLCGAREQPSRLLSRSDFLKKIGLHALELGDAVVDALGPAARELRPISPVRRAVTRQLRELSADFHQR